MFKKINLWIVLLIIYFLLIGSLLFGALVRQELEGSKKFGIYSKFALEVSRFPSKIFKVYQGLKDSHIDFSSSSKLDLNEFDFKNDNEVLKNKHLLISKYSPIDNQSIIELVRAKDKKIIFKWN